ncbi:MAG: hypothetical protein U1F87_18715 [Kiritimatiellia bacterium]
MSDADFLSEVSIFISSPSAGSLTTPSLQARAQYRLDRDGQRRRAFHRLHLPNLYNGEPDFLHTVRIEHRPRVLTLGDSEQVRMAVDETSDGDGDGLPDFLGAHPPAVIRRTERGATAPTATTTRTVSATCRNSWPA